MFKKLTAATFFGLALVAAVYYASRTYAPLPAGSQADLIIVQKSARLLSAYSHGTLLRAYNVSLGPEPVGPKTRAGDGRTPEGPYLIDHHNPTSAFHRALHVSYPSHDDIARAHSASYPLGGDIMVHGIRDSLRWIGHAHLLVDWTVGCIAVTDPEIDELYRIVPDGTPIEIRP